MVKSNEQTVEGYLASLDGERRAAITAVRKVIKKNLPKGFEEVMDWGMITYVVPLSKYPNTYNGHPIGVAALAAQKNYNAVYLDVYKSKEEEAWFRSEYAKTGKKLDMGKACVRFKALEDLPLELIGRTVALKSVDDVIAQADAADAYRKKPVKKAAASAKKKAPAKKAPVSAKKKAAKKPAPRKAAPRRAPSR